MLEELNDYDWEEVFAFSGGASGYGEPNVSSVIDIPSGRSCSDTYFCRDDVVTIYGMSDGENDGRDWMIYGKLRDGRYFFLSAGCCYTGWDAMGGGSATLCPTKRGIIRSGMTSEARRVFGLEDNNIGEIKLKEFKNPRTGFTTLTKKRKKKKKIKKFGDAIISSLEL